MNIIFLYLAIACASVSKSSFTPPKWEGHWEAFSETVAEKKIGTLDIDKIKGKEYSWKLWLKNDNQFIGDNDGCPDMNYEGTATYNGVYGLNANIKGIGFVYYAETGIINLFHDYSDKELTDESMCFNGNFVKKGK